jgi:hypothetical protein
MRGGAVRRRIAVAAALAGLVIGLGGAPAFADGVYHSSHYVLTAVNAAPLRSGFVENIHANGPNVYAHEQYVLNGAVPNTTYRVILMISPLDTTCSSPSITIPSATIQTNAVGNGVSYHVFTPADADGLRGLTVGIIWTVSSGSSPSYQTGCETVVLD